MAVCVGMLSMQLSYRLQPEHLIQDGLLVERIQRRRKNTIMLVLSAFLIGLGLSVGQANGSVLFLSVGLSTLVLNLGFRYVLLPYLLKRQVRMLDWREQQQAFVVTVSDQYLQVKHAGQTQQITWAEIEHWYVGQLSLVIELPLRQAILLPFEAFESTAQRQAFEQQLSRQVGPARR